MQFLSSLIGSQKRLNSYLERRSRFEEKILLDRYEFIKTLESKIFSIATDINRHHNRIPVEGLFNGRDIPRLTEVYQQLSANRYLVSDDFFDVLSKQSSVLMRLANAKSDTDLEHIDREYTGLQNEFNRLMNNEFGINEISWTSNKGAVQSE